MLALFRSDALQIIRTRIECPNENLAPVELVANRLTLAKRRWRGKAEDGREFGFDLTEPLDHGAIFFQNEASIYRVRQLSEALLKLEPMDATQAARIAWQIGNLHCPIMFREGSLFSEDNAFLRQLCEREEILFTRIEAIFQPLSGAAAHQH